MDYMDFKIKASYVHGSSDSVDYDTKTEDIIE